MADQSQVTISLPSPASITEDSLAVSIAQVHQQVIAKRVGAAIKSAKKVNRWSAEKMAKILGSHLSRQKIGRMCQGGATLGRMGFDEVTSTLSILNVPTDKILLNECERCFLSFHAVLMVQRLWLSRFDSSCERISSTRFLADEAVARESPSRPHAFGPDGSQTPDHAGLRRLVEMITSSQFPALVSAAKHLFCPFDGELDALRGTLHSNRIATDEWDSDFEAAKRLYQAWHKYCDSAFLHSKPQAFREIELAQQVGLFTYCNSGPIRAASLEAFFAQSALLRKKVNRLRAQAFKCIIGGDVVVLTDSDAFQSGTAHIPVNTES